MSKLVYYIRNGFYSSLVGAGAQIIIDIVQQKKSVDVFSLLDSDRYCINVLLLSDYIKEKDYTFVWPDI